MPISAGIALGSLGSAGLGYLGSQKSASTIGQYGQSAISAIQSMFGQAQGALNPFIGAGQSVLTTLQKLLTPGADQTATLSQLPGFKFQSEWGGMGATNALAARGLGGSSGPLAKAISDYNQGLAGTSFGNLTGMLQNFANMGAGSASALAGAAGQAGGQLGSTFSTLGSSLAGAQMGGYNALAGGLQSGGSSIGNYLMWSKLLGGGLGGSQVSPDGGIYGGIQVPGFNPIPQLGGGPS